MSFWSLHITYLGPLIPLIKTWFENKACAIIASVIKLYQLYFAVVSGFVLVKSFVCSARSWTVAILKGWETGIPVSLTAGVGTCWASKMTRRKSSVFWKISCKVFLSDIFSWFSEANTVIHDLSGLLLAETIGCHTQHKRWNHLCEVIQQPKPYKYVLESIWSQVINQNCQSWQGIYFCACSGLQLQYRQNTFVLEKWWKGNGLIDLLFNTAHFK